MDRRRDVSSVGSFYRAGPPITIAKEMLKYKLGLVGVKGWYRTNREVHTKFWWEYPKAKRPLGSHSSRCEENIKIDLQGI
jgi:hypothetical protein